MKNKIATLLRRKRIARTLGFEFWGIRLTCNPRWISLNDRRLPLTFPRTEQRPFNPDLALVLMDDEYDISRFNPSRIRRVVDVGANIGIFSLHAWRLFPNAQIHAYEPNFRVYIRARRNLKAIGATVFQQAVSNREGRCCLIDRGHSRGAYTVPSTFGTIPLTSVRTVMERAGGEVDLLKLDCEGAEWDILSDCNSVRRARHICMEYHLDVHHRSPDQLYHIADTVGFKVTELRPKHDTHLGIAWLNRTD